MNWRVLFSGPCQSDCLRPLFLLGSVYLSFLCSPTRRWAFIRQTTLTKKIADRQAKCRSSTANLRQVNHLLQSPSLQKKMLWSCGALFFVAILLLVYVIRWEIMPPPSTDKIILNVNFVEDITIEEAEKIADGYEAQILEQFKKEVAFTFVEVNKNSSTIFANIRRGISSEVLKAKMENAFPETPQHRIHVREWSPATLSVPNPPLLELTINDPNPETALLRLERIRESLGSFEELGWRKADPSTRKVDYISLRPRQEWINQLKARDNPVDLNQVLSQLAMTPIQRLSLIH